MGGYRGGCSGENRVLRKGYKKTTVAMAKARAHLNSVQRSTKPPRVGLKVNVRCSAFLSDLSDVEISSPTPPTKQRKAMWATTIMWWSKNYNKKVPTGHDGHSGDTGHTEGKKTTYRHA